MDWAAVDPVAREVAHWAAAVPFVFLAFLRVRGRTIEPGYWFVAIGFNVSVFADFATKFLGLDWEVQPYYLPLQAALIAFGLTVDKARVQDIVAIVATLLLVAGASLSDGPDVWVRAAVSAALLALAWNHRLAWPVVVYFVLGTALYFKMLTYGKDVDAARPWWYGYQGSRLLAFGLFGRAAWRA